MNLEMNENERNAIDWLVEVFQLVCSREHFDG